MSSDKLEEFPIRFTGKNYSAWEFQFKLFVKGKELWGHFDGSVPAPQGAEALSKWEIHDARVMTSLLISVESHLVLNLRPYKTVAAMWTYLNTVYNQDNSAKRFHLEYEMANFTNLSSSLTNVFVSPNLSTNLICIGQLVNNNCNVHFSRFGCVVQDQVSGRMIAKGPKVGRLFPLHVSPSTFIPSFPLLSFSCNVVGSGNKMWHRCLGHPNSDVLRTLFNSGLLGNKACSSIDLSFDCTSCKLGKSKVLPFPHHASQCFKLIHSDVWGIAPVVSHAHYKYFVTFINDFSRFTWVYFLRAKGEVISVFQRFLALLET